MAPTGRQRCVTMPHAVLHPQAPRLSRRTSDFPAKAHGSRRSRHSVREVLFQLSDAHNAVRLARSGENPRRQRESQGVQIRRAVPEPATLGLMVLGLLGAGILRTQTPELTDAFWPTRERPLPRGRFHMRSVVVGNAVVTPPAPLLPGRMRPGSEASRVMSSVRRRGGRCSEAPPCFHSCFNLPLGGRNCA
jgi:hypothetical protein